MQSNNRLSDTGLKQERAAMGRRKELSHEWEELKATVRLTVHNELTLPDEPQARQGLRGVKLEVTRSLPNLAPLNHSGSHSTGNHAAAKVVSKPTRPSNLPRFAALFALPLRPQNCQRPGISAKPKSSRRRKHWQRPSRRRLRVPVLRRGRSCSTAGRPRPSNQQKLPWIVFSGPKNWLRRQRWICRTTSCR